MKMSNNLWCVVERSDNKIYINSDEVFPTRSSARKYLKETKDQIREVRKQTGNLYGMNPRDLFIRKLSLTGKRG